MSGDVLSSESEKNGMGQPEKGPLLGSEEVRGVRNGV